MTIGRKTDSGKLSFKLLPLDALKETVRVLMFGAYDRFVRADGTEGKGKGYGENNWEKVPNARERYYDASLRHLTSWFEGERNDPESGCHHLAHSICCNLFALALDLREDVKRALTPIGHTGDRIAYGVDFAPPGSEDASAVTAVRVDPKGRVSILGTAMAHAIPEEYHEALDRLNRFAAGKQAGYAINIEVDTFALYSIELAPALAQAHLYPGLAAAQLALRSGEILVCEHGAFVTSSEYHETMRIHVPDGDPDDNHRHALMIALPDSDHGFKRPRVVRLVAVRKRAKEASEPQEVPSAPDPTEDASTRQGEALAGEICGCTMMDRCAKHQDKKAPETKGPEASKGVILAGPTEDAEDIPF